MLRAAAAVLRVTLLLSAHVAYARHIIDASHDYYAVEALPCCRLLLPMMLLADAVAAGCR